MNTYNDLIFLFKRGIVPKKHKMSPVEHAHEQGLYMGCPGKEIYYALSSLTNSEADKLVPIVANSFPSQPPGKSPHLSVFWRYFYGVFDKQGTFNSKSNVNSLVKDWAPYFDFANKVIDFYKQMPDKHYGQLLATEMLAHRYGDIFVLFGDAHKQKMITAYEQVHKLSIEINAKKNAFSSLFWCALYLYGRDNLLFHEYAIRFLLAANQYATSINTKSKVVGILNRLHALSTPKEMRKICKMYKNFDNKVMKSFGFKKLSFDKSLLGVK